MGKFRFLTAGESHGKGLSVIIEGMPSNLSIDEDYIEKDMSRRQKGYGSGGRMKIEKDRAEIQTGVRHGKTLGSPISLWIENKDWVNWTTPMSINPVDANEDIKLQTKIVPGHADFPGTLKFNHKDVRNVLERASARETAARVAAASICKKFLSELGVLTTDLVEDPREQTTLGFQMNKQGGSVSPFERRENRRGRMSGQGGNADDLEDY